MAQVKNSIFSETSKKNNDGIVNIPVDIGRIKEDLQNESISSVFSTTGLISSILNELMENVELFALFLLICFYFYT